MKIDTLITGAKGVAAVNFGPEIVDVVAQQLQSPDQLNSYLQIISTIILSAISFWKLIKKPKPKAN